jgi:hypothetical protein
VQKSIWRGFEENIFIEHQTLRTVMYRRPRTFFQGRAKTYYLPKNTLKILFSSKKSKNILYLPASGGGKGTLLPTHADAHAVMAIKKIRSIAFEKNT